MADDFRLRHRDLLTGSYDCVDRIVLNAFFQLGYQPGGLRTWWRRLHDGSDEELDNTHLMRMVGRFARRVQGQGRSRRGPLVDRRYPYELLAEAGNPVHLSPIRTTNAGQGFQGFFRPTA